jgi:hypothetical protein
MQNVSFQKLSRVGAYVSSRYCCCAIFRFSSKRDLKIEASTTLCRFTGLKLHLSYRATATELSLPVQTVMIYENDRLDSVSASLVQ